MNFQNIVITKRLLGVGLVLAGLAGIVGSIGVDLIGAGQFGGFGPTQQRAAAACILFMIVGGTLIPLGNRPA